MRKWANIRHYHWTLVFVFAGVFATLFAFATYNLFRYSMANLSVLQRYGLMAVQEGALLQTLEIIIGGAFALFCFLGFKLCEGELVLRYRRWMQPPQ